LYQDSKRRLGTRASSEVRAHAFFAGDASFRTHGAPNPPVDWRALEAGTAPPALVPPRVAFIEAECANALHMYQQASLEPAEW
jgi:hypothetical protein